MYLWKVEKDKIYADMKGYRGDRVGVANLAKREGEGRQREMRKEKGKPGKAPPPKKNEKKKKQTKEQR